MSEDVVNSIEKIFGIETLDKKNYLYALTHPSYIMENNMVYTECYERLEFLGDAVLKLAVSNILYKKYPKYSEGQMSKIRSIIVSDSILAKIASKIGLDNLILAGKHDAKQGINKLESVLACAFEAILGAYFLDGKFNDICCVLLNWFEEYIIEVDKNFEKYNAKAILQEYTQADTKQTPVYKLIDTTGKEHNKMFVVEVSYKGEVVASGEGKSKKEAEQHAAFEACKRLGVLKNV